MTASLPGPDAAEQAQVMMFPPPLLTVGMVFSHPVCARCGAACSARVQTVSTAVEGHVVPTLLCAVHS